MPFSAFHLAFLALEEKIACRQIRNVGLQTAFMNGNMTVKVPHSFHMYEKNTKSSSHKDMQSLTAYFFIAVPTQAPSSFKVIAQTSTSVLASWKPLLGDAANGNIVGFKLFYRKLGYNTSQTIQTINSSTSSVSGLEKYTKYEFQVLAFTSVGDGPTSVRQVVRTKEDGKSD